MPEEAYTKLITITLTATDKALLIKLARSQNMSMRAFVRQLLHDAAISRQTKQKRISRDRGGASANAE